MNLRSLFAKIFLWFWLAITVVIAALALVTWLYPYSAVPSGNLPDRLHELQVRGALAVYQLQGQEAFEKHRKQLESASHLRTYFLDDQGKELSGQTVPEALLAFAREHRSQIDQNERVMVGQPSRLAIPMTDSQGRRYLALVQGDRSGFRSGPGPRRGPESQPGSATRRDSPRTTQPDSARSAERGHDHDDAHSYDGGRGPGPGRGRGPGPPPPSETLPGFELLVPAHVLLLRLLAVVLAAGLVCYALARYLTAPVRQLQYAARQLASGDLTTRVGNSLAARRDEIGTLGRDFDRMAEQVQGLVTTQRRLLQDVSHELRSPLARLNVALELAGREADPSAAPALARVGREAERLNELIGQLLTLARLEGGAAQAQHIRIDLRALVIDVAADADFEAARNCRVRVTRSDACEIRGSPDLLRSALENVMRNAVHYTAGGSDVEVTLHHQQQAAAPAAIIEIRDHGPGIPEDALQQIFQPFYRVSSARDRKSGGTGLGLAITERAVGLHGGSVRAANAPGGGLLVYITFPLGGDNRAHADLER